MTIDLTGLEDYRTDNTRESEVGVKLVFPGGRWLRVLRAGGSNERYRKALEREARPYRYSLEQGKTLSRKVNDEIMHRVYAKAVVIDWGGFKDSQGNEVAYNQEGMIEVFRALPELFSQTAELATRAATFQEQQVEEAKKNLGEISSGS